MSRNRTLERRKEREQQRKRQRQTMMLIGIVAIAVILVIIFVLISQPAEAPISSAALTRYEGIPQTTTDEGFPQLGSADAPVKVVEYSSFDCTHCFEFHESVMPTLINRIRAGEVQFTYVPMYGTGGIANGEGAARAAICVGEQGKFWSFHDSLFDWQGAYANTAFSENRLKTGLDNLDINRAQWDQCMASSLPGNVVNAALRAGQLQNIPGTPSLVINGTIAQSIDLTSVNTAIDEALAASGQSPVPLSEATAEATVEATVQPTAEMTAESTAEMTQEATAETTAAP